MRASVRCASIGAVTSAAMILASASPAVAAARHPAKAKPSHFTIHGVVVGVHGNTVKVLSSTAKVGKKTTHNRLVTLTLTTRTKKAKRTSRAAKEVADTSAPAVGAAIAATGTVAGSTLVTSAETTTVLPAEALVGKVSSVSADGSQFTVLTHDQVDGDHAEHNNNDGTTVTAAGAPVTGPAVAVDSYVVVLGEAAEHEMLAAKIYTFTSAPALAVGAVTAADGAAKTLTVDAQGSERDGQEQDDQPDGSNPEVSVDASAADVFVNGAAPAPAPAPADPNAAAAPPAFPAVGDQVLTVGTAGSSPDTLVASLVFDFNSADRGTVQDNQENEDQGNGGQGNGGQGGDQHDD